MENLNLFEALQILSKKKNVKAVSYIDGLTKEIKWSKEKQRTGSTDTYKEIIFKNLTGHEQSFKLTDFMIEQQNYKIWNIVKEE